MHPEELRTLVLVVAIAALSPLISDLSKRWTRIPGVVVEIALGIVIGPHVLGWAHLSEVLAVLAEMGLVLLIFLAGFEIDLPQVKGTPLTRALMGWVVSLVLAVGVAAALHASGVTSGIRFVAVALTTTAIGTLLPILGDAGVLPTRFGASVLASGAMGELGPIVAISLALTSDEPGRTTLILLGFAVVTGLAGWLATRNAPPRVVRLISHTLHSSGQLGVRISVLLCVLLVWMASRFELDVLLGAFAAGMIARLFLVTTDAADEDVAHRHEVQLRLESLGFGFFIPLFFVVSGVKFDLGAFDSAGTVLKIPLFLVLFVVVRGLPALLLYRKDFPAGQVRALGLLQSAALPLVVVITGIGVEEGLMRPDNAAAMVGAGLLSVIVFPIIGLGWYRRADEQSASESDAPLHA